MKILPIVTPFIMLFTTLAVSADMIDDLEDGNNQNETGYYWFYYDNPCDDRMVINCMIDENGYKVMKPVDGKGYNEGYAAELSWKFGNKPAGCTHNRLAGLGTMLCSESAVGAEWTDGATEISFYGRANASLKIRVEIATSDVKDYGYYHQDVSITEEWKKFTVKFAELSQPDWAQHIEFKKANVTKIQFNVTEEIAGTPDSGSLFIDDLAINFEIPGLKMISGEPGQQIQGTLLADFQGKDPEGTNFATWWYIYSDSKGNGEPKSAFTYGTMINEDTYEPQLSVEENNTNGYNSSAGMKIAFKLGGSSTQSTDIVKPFVGIGCMLSNSDQYPGTGKNSVIRPTNARNTVGFYFDYKTESTSDYFKYFEIEFYDTDSLPHGMSFSTKLPVTDGAWRSATIPWDKLALPDWPDKIAALSDAEKTLNLDRLDKLQIKFQNLKGVEAAASFDNFRFVGCIGCCCEASVSPERLKRTSLPSRIVTDGLSVTLGSLPAGTHYGVIELVGINGRVITKEKVHAVSSSSINLRTGKLANGVYLLKVNTTYGNNRVFSSNERFTICN